MPVYLGCKSTFLTKGALTRHMLNCAESIRKKDATRKCMFCGAPDHGKFFKHVHETVDHVLTDKCWTAIHQIRAEDPSALKNLMAPTRSNFELVRDTESALFTGFDNDRYADRRFYEKDNSIHNSFLSASGPSNVQSSEPGHSGLSPQMEALMGDSTIPPLSSDNQGNAILMMFSNMMF